MGAAKQAAARSIMKAHLRIARPVSDLPRAERMYKIGLTLETIADFEDHQGFDGVMLGDRDGYFHFEFTYCRHHPVVPSPSAEDLIVFFLPAQDDWNHRCAMLSQAGFSKVQSFNPYWDRLGRTFQDFDGYRIVIQRSAWSNAA